MSLLYNLEQEEQVYSFLRRRRIHSKFSQRGQNKMEDHEANDNSPEGFASPDPNLSALVPMLFSHGGQPKNAWRGVMTGLGDVASFTLIATAVVVSAPVKGGMMGYEKAGVLGSIGGTIGGAVVGAVAAAVIALAGVTSCAYQTIVGLIRTPAAFMGMSSGKRWDVDAQKWVPYDLEVETQKFGDVTDEMFVEHVKAMGDATSFFAAGTDEGTIGELTSKQEKGGEDTSGSGSGSGFDSSGSGSGSKGSSKGESGGHDAKKGRKKKNVVDREMYDVLGIEPEATAAEIKKAYYVKARESHPDRNPGDELAKEKFQKIGQAYQVLADERLRNAYDLKGKPAMGTAPNMDAGFIYTMIFGNDQFEELIGELNIATSLKVMTDSTKPFDFVRFRQRKRELDCALKLVARLQVFVDGDEEEFLRKAHDEADNLCECKLGATLLAIIGTVYIEQARANVSTVDSIIISTKHIGESISSAVSKISFGISSFFNAIEMNKIHQAAEKKHEDEELRLINNLPTEEKERRLAEREARGSAATNHSRAAPGSLEGMYGPNPTKEEKQLVARKIKNLTSNIFGVLWQITVADIRSTLKHVCKLVLRDVSVTPNTTERRTAAMRKLGEIFVSKNVDEGASMEDLLSRMGTQTGLFDPSAAATSTAAGEELQGNGDDDGGVDGIYTQTGAGSSTEYESRTRGQASNSGGGSCNGSGSGSNEGTKQFTRQELVNMIAAVPDYSTKDLKKHITSLGGDCSQCIEKADLVMKLNDVLCEKLTRYPDGNE